jgi:hypothetical protein
MMETLGSIFLREYTHWEKLVSPAMEPAFGHKATVDLVNGWGAWKVHRLDKHLAAVNADSYEWLALELFWSEECRDLGDLEEPREEDNYW